MHFTLKSSACLLLALSSAANASILDVLKPLHALAAQPTESTSFIDQQAMQTPIPTGALQFQKRDAAKKVKINKEYMNEQLKKQGLLPSTTDDTPAPWLRTIYGSIAEVVHPTVIHSITFNAKPPATTDGLEEWVSLKDDGSPKTIKPKMKNGKIKNGKPDPKTYFQTASTVVYNQKDLKAHNLKEDDTHVEVVWLPEDDTYSSLNPLMRCTPDLYRKKGPAGMDRSEPFCSPKENTSLKVGVAHFLTWYTRYFEEAQYVKVHYAFVKENKSDKGMKKREIPGFAAEKAVIDQKTTIEDAIGDIPGTFFSSEWIMNRDGYYPIEIEEEWLKGEHYKKVMISIQPDTVEDEDFNLLESDHIIVNFQIKATVSKNSKLDRHLQDQVGTGDDVYYVIMSVPTVVILAAFGMYMFLHCNRKHRDLSHIKKPKKSRYGNNGKYDLPYAITDINKPANYKKV
ncbi:hypothetical protein CANARDRAFT_28013 [[Candida] arabinofermentans NRRL YB-2248]|uniref:Protein PBN1 n=1 Tax=[Candida] arabinofermentans NRRL YB-2248 TaxID=983967 RepID=A0A1E4T2N0_9ASCO|nr:hypothetical protein CANARDRAFT_28013 [[Candida] arabinofermentans NRRL YB-2248]